MTIKTRPPKNYTEGRDFERWMYSIYKKIGESDTLLDDIDARSVVPLLSRMYELERRISQLERNQGNRNHTYAALERRIDDVERSL